MRATARDGRSSAVEAPAVRRADQALRDLLGSGSDILVLRLTLLLLLLHGGRSWQLDIPLTILCGAMLVFPTLTRQPILWWSLAGVLIVSKFADWAWIDNYEYLITYWTLACALAVSSKDVSWVLSWNARVLLALAFLFAVSQKILAGEYVDGSFLHLAFLTDPRVEGAVRTIGGLEPTSLPANRLVLAALQGLPPGTAEVQLQTSDAVIVLAQAASFWTLAIEGTLAVLFLLPRRFRVSAWRDAILMLFIVTTYTLLPVVGFAFVLVVLGLAQCEERRYWTRASYLVLLAAIQFIAVPWQEFLPA